MIPRNKQVIKRANPVERAIATLNELSTTIEEGWLHDDTTPIQDKRFMLAAQKIREANKLLIENNEEFKRDKP